MVKGVIYYTITKKKNIWDLKISGGIGVRRSTEGEVLGGGGLY